MHREIAKEMLQFLKESPTAFHAVQTMQKELEKNGYKRLRESEKWEIAPGGAYYVTRNDSSLIAFCPGTELSEVHAAEHRRLWRDAACHMVRQAAVSGGPGDCKGR